MLIGFEVGAEVAGASSAIHALAAREGWVGLLPVSQSNVHTLLAHVMLAKHLWVWEA